MSFVLTVFSPHSLRLNVELGDKSFSSLPADQALCIGDATLGGSFYFSGDLVPNFEAAQLAHFGTGAFNILQVVDGGYQILQDRLGLRPLYIYKSDGAAAVSDSLWALVRALRAAGQVPQINQGAFDLMLASDKFVAEHPLTMDTLVDGVRVSIPGSTLTVRAGAVAEVPRVTPSRIGLGEKAYQERLHEAVSEIAENVRAPIDSSRFDYYYADITGGRDSRAVLAALRCANRVGSVRFRHRPCGMVEGLLAQSLVAISGGEFVTGQPGDTYHIVVEEYLEEQFQQYMGVNHSLASRFALRQEPSAPSVLFRGGLGEVYRNHYLKPVAKEGQGLDFPFAGMLNKRQLLPTERQDAAVKLLHAGLATMPGEAEEERLYWHYRCLRNRFHFGLANVFSDFHVINPLYSHAALDLAEQMPMSWLSSGRLMAELTAALDNELAGLPYDSEFAEGTVPTRKFERMPRVTYSPSKKTWYSGIRGGERKATVDESVYRQTRELAEWYFSEVEPSAGGADISRYMQGLEKNIATGKFKFVVRDWFKFRTAAWLVNGGGSLNRL